MPYYQIQRTTQTSRKKSPLGKKRGSKIIIDPDGKRLWIHSKTALPETKGVKKITKRDYDAVVKKAGQSREKGMYLSEFMPGVQRLEHIDNWTLESYTLRQADLDGTAIKIGRPALRIRFGGGRNDTIYLGHSLESPIGITALVLRAYHWNPGDDEVAVGLLFTTERQRPWLEIETMPMPSKVTTDLHFDLSQLDQTALAKTDRLNLVITTKADEGFLMVERLLAIGMGDEST